MKELSIQEKARRYDEILARATGAYLPYYTEDIMSKVKEFVDYLLPELKESEDLRIIKAIKYGIDHVFTNNTTVFEVTKEQCLFWLEKQGKKKSADKVEPKFKVGDWVVYTGYLLKDSGKEIYVMQVASVEDNRYNFTDTSTLCFDSEKDMRSWTIQDAKDGDVLVYGDNPEDHHVEIIMLFKSKRGSISASNYFHIFNNEFRVNSWCDCGKSAHPATKEQRDILFKKMQEVGYEWDAEKKKLKKIIDEEQIKKNLKDNSFRRMFEQKSWSEEDEKCYNSALWHIKNSISNGKSDTITECDVLNWFKSLKSRVQPQPKWSEEEWNEYYQALAEANEELDEEMIQDTIEMNADY